jgi:hypothetical protein
MKKDLQIDVHSRKHNWKLLNHRDILKRCLREEISRKWQLLHREYAEYVPSAIK